MNSPAAYGSISTNEAELLLAHFMKSLAAGPTLKIKSMIETAGSNPGHT
jgi:hypothetical protein